MLMYLHSMSSVSDVLALLVLFSCVHTCSLPFPIPFYPAIVFGMGSLMTVVSIAMLGDMRRRYRLRDIQGQMRTKLEELGFMAAESTHHKN